MGQFSASDEAAVSSEWSQIGLNAGSSGNVTLDDALWTTTNTLTIGSAGNGEFNASNGAVITAGSIKLAAASGITGSLTVTNSTVVTENISADNAAGASVEFDGAQVKLLGGSSVSDTSLISGFNAGTAVIASGGLTVDTQGGNAQIPSSLSGSGSLTKTGDGRLRLTTANTFSGGVSVQGGVLEIASADALGSGTTSLGTAELRAIADLALSGTTILAIEAAQTGTLSATNGNMLTVTSSVVLASGATLSIGSAGNTGTIVFAPESLTAPDSAQIAVQFGTLVASNGGLAQLTAIAAATTVASGATLDFQDQTGNGINTLFGAGTVNTGTSSATTLIVNSGSFSGNISGDGALVKETEGTLMLSGQNAFIGGTTVNAGTLIVDGSLSFGQGNVQLNGGTLGGSGSLGSIMLNAGTVAPSGTLTAQGLYWTSGTLLFDLGPTSATSDLLAIDIVTGYGAAGTLYNFTFVDAGLVVGTTYTLLTFLSSDIAIDDFRFTNGGGFDGQFAYDSGALKFTVTAVPEPHGYAIVAAALLVGEIFRRRRKAV